MAACRTLAELTIVATLLAGCGDFAVPSSRIAAEAQPAAPEICIGGAVPEAAWSAEPSGPELPPAGGGGAGEGPAVGAPPPAWALNDFQPQSCGYQATYGLEAFRGRVTVVALWSGS